MVNEYARDFALFLPAIVFIIGCLLAFATGTSWGTFGILIPITLAIFPLDDPMGVVCVSACMAGAVCGDHCSPISDTTIMASAGAQCDHVNHVSTQLPYATACAFIACISYIVAGLLITSVPPACWPCLSASCWYWASCCSCVPTATAWRAEPHTIHCKKKGPIHLDGPFL